MIPVFVGIASFALVLLLGGLMRAASKQTIDDSALIRARLKQLYDERGYPRD
jgi:hypothetical protein